MANGVLYTANQGGSLTARDGATGTTLKTLSLGAPTFGGISTTGAAVYVAVGIGPAPSPAPQQDGTGSIVAFGDTSRSGAPRPGGGDDGGGGGGSTHARRARIRLTVSPRSVRARRRTVFHFTARAASRRVAGATIRFAGRRARTGRRGTARIVSRLWRGRHVARASKPGLRGGRVTVRARRPE
jgi:hypothetical protein